jgi:O-acetylhomoserine (thiol)-lyase
MNTKVLHGAYVPEETTGATAPPIFQNTSFAYKSAEELEAVFSGRDAGFVYSRINNPTLDRFERRICSLEDGLASVSCASGMAAISTTALALSESGSEIVSANSIFGGTYSLFARTLPRYGIKTHFVETTDIEAYRQAITDKTRLIFLETIGNPKLDVPDIRSIAGVAEEFGVALVVDNTTTTPVLCRPKELGADIVIHSTSKYVNGHGNAIGGVVTDCGTFDWSAPRYGQLKPYHHRLGQFALIANLRDRIHRDLGACFSPFNAFLMSTGIDSLALRMERHCSNCSQIAEHLNNDPRVESTVYPGLPGHPNHETARKQFSDRYGGILTLKLGTKERCFNFINALNYAQNVANLGDVKTLVIHPASTFCRDANEEEKLAMGVTSDLVRLSVGIEHTGDIMEDIDQALTTGVYS